MRSIPGTTPRPDRGCLYVQSIDPSTFDDELDELFFFEGSAAPTSGSLGADNAALQLDEGLRLFAVSFNGDVPAWRTTVIEWCERDGRLFAELEGGQLVLSDGRAIPLRDCRAEFF